VVYITYAAILGTLGIALWRADSKLSAVALVVLVFYSRWEVIEELLLRITNLALSWKGKFQLKVARDLKSGRQLPAPLAVPQDAIPVKAELPEASPQYLSEDEVFEIVRNLPDVKDFTASVAKPIYMNNGLRPSRKGSQERAAYLIQVAESRPTHLATFRWVYVDAITGEVLENQ
jgi:hypothetical protein